MRSHRRAEHSSMSACSKAKQANSGKRWNSYGVKSRQHQGNS